MVATVVALGVLLSGCSEWEDRLSSDGGQEFRKFSPEVKQSSADTGSGSSTGSNTSGQSAGGDDAQQDQNSNGGAGDQAGDSVPSLATTAIVWKPVSEGDGNLVVLTPTRFGTPGIAVLDSAGRTVESGRYIGHTNGNRATYRFSRPGSAYSAPAYLRVDSAVYRVDNPAGRIN